MRFTQLLEVARGHQTSPGYRQGCGARSRPQRRAGCAGGLAAIVDRDSVPRKMKLQAGTRKRRVSPNQKTGREEEKKKYRIARKGLTQEGPLQKPILFSAPQRRGSPVEGGSIQGVVGRPW
jgi:hypothetical protein